MAAASGDDVVGEAYALLGLALTRGRRGEYEAAEINLRTALGSAARVGNLLLHGRVLLALAELALPRLARLTRVIALSHSTDPHLVTRALNAGAAAFLVHGEYSTTQLARALAEARPAKVHLSAPTAAAAARQVHGPTQQPLPPAESATRDQLSRREGEVMDCIARGLSNSDTARALGLSEKTV